MKKLLSIVVMLIIMSCGLHAQTYKTMTFGGIERQYIEYIPSSYDASTPAPIMFFLHGLGDNITSAFNNCDFTAIAEEHGWILVYPQATDFSVELPGVGTYQFNSIWNAGISVTLTFMIYGFPVSFDITLNGEVDDEGFLMSILSNMKDEYAIDESQIYFTGFSLGACMCHRMGINYGDMINGVASISGIVGNDMIEMPPYGNVNMLVAFGTEDQVIEYGTATYNAGEYGSFNIGLDAEATVKFWYEHNQCETTPVVEQYPDLVNDGLTFTMSQYLNGVNDSRVGFLKIEGGEHSWYQGPNYDIDYPTEIYRFFTNTLDVTSTEEYQDNLLNVYPNPAKDIVYLDLNGSAIVTVYDLTGSKVLETRTQGTLDVSTLSNGIYFMQVGTKMNKIIINK